MAVPSTAFRYPAIPASSEQASLAPIFKDKNHFLKSYDGKEVKRMADKEMLDIISQLMDDNELEQRDPA